MSTLPESVTLEATHERIPLYRCPLPDRCIATAEDFKAAVRHLLIPASPAGAAVVVPAGAIARDVFDPSPLGVVDFEHGGAGFHHHRLLEVALVSMDVRESIGTLITHHAAVIAAASDFLSDPQERAYIQNMAGAIMGPMLEDSLQRISSDAHSLPQRYAALRQVLTLPFGQRMYRIFKGIQHALGTEVLTADWQQNDLCLIRRDNVHARDIRTAETRSSHLALRSLKTRVTNGMGEQVPNPVQSD